MGRVGWGPTVGACEPVGRGRAFGAYLRAAAAASPRLLFYQSPSRDLATRVVGVRAGSRSLRSPRRRRSRRSPVRSRTPSRTPRGRGVRPGGVGQSA